MCNTHLFQAKLGVKHDMVVNRNDSVNITDITPKPSKPPKQNTGPMQKKPAQNTSSSGDDLSFIFQALEDFSTN